MKNALATVLVTVLVLSLTSNMVPWFNVLAISGLLCLYFLRNRRTLPYEWLKPGQAIRFLVAADTFWVLSYLLSGAPISNFFSFDFLRLDGAVLIGYVPLLLLRDCDLRPRTISRLVFVYLSILAGLALLGAFQFLSQVGGLDYDAEPNGLPMNVLYRSYLTTDVFHGWYRAHNAAGSVYAMASCMALALALGRKKAGVFTWPSLLFAATFTGLVISQSRSGYISFFAALVFVFLRSKQNAKAMARIAIFVAVPVAVFWLSQALISRRVQWMTNLADPNVLERFDYYQRAVEDFADSPLIGIGFGRYNDDGLTFSGTRHFIYLATGDKSSTWITTRTILICTSSPREGLSACS